AISKLIIENSILPRFKAGDFAGGISRGGDDIIQVLSGDAEGWKLRASRGPDDQMTTWEILLVIFFGLVFFMIMRAIWRDATRGAGAVGRRGRGGPVFFPLPSSSSSWGSGSSGSSWSGSSSGGFSGGGGSFGGGGASGSW